MSARTLVCATCKVIMIVVRDGKIRKDAAVYCSSCDQRAMKPDAMRPEVDVPDFLAGIFGRGGRGER